PTTLRMEPPPPFTASKTGDDSGPSLLDAIGEPADHVLDLVPTRPRERPRRGVPEIPTRAVLGAEPEQPAAVHAPPALRPAPAGERAQAQQRLVIERGPVPGPQLPDPIREDGGRDHLDRLVPLLVRGQAPVQRADERVGEGVGKRDPGWCVDTLREGRQLPV